MIFILIVVFITQIRQSKHAICVYVREGLIGNYKLIGQTIGKGMYKIQLNSRFYIFIILFLIDDYPAHGNNTILVLISPPSLTHTKYIFVYSRSICED